MAETVPPDLGPFAQKWSEDAGAYLLQCGDLGWHDLQSMSSLGRRSFASALLLTILVGAPACALNPYSVTVTGVSSSTRTIEASLAEPGPIAHEVVISGYWSTKRKGLINLQHPEAKAAGLENGEVPIVLSVHVLRHPEHGLFVIDTGVSQARVDGEPDGAKGLAKSVLKGLKAERSLASIVEAGGGDLRGVLLTHMHFDHVLGLDDVPISVPLFTGPGESAAKRFGNGLLRATYRELLRDREIREWTFDEAPVKDPLAGAVDFFGDGSLWVLPCPGHTPGSVAYLVRSTAGPLLITGDTSHTHWGFEHGVEPGTFTDDQEGNARSLSALRDLARKYQIPTYVGHEEGTTLLDGQG